MKEELHKYYKLPLQLITTINNPIDKILIGEKISDTNPLDKQFYNYVAVGRLHPIKGYNTLIQAFAKVINIHKRSRLYIIGGISDILYYQQLNDLTKSLSIDKNVFFEGFQSNPYKYLYNADAFVLSSIKEGLPNALLEALYLGVPVVATRCVPFVDKIVKPGKNGFTIDPEDVNQLFSKLVEIHTIEKRKSFIDPINSEEQVKNLFEKIF